MYTKEKELILSSSCHLICFEDDFFFAGQFVIYFGDDEPQMPGVSHVIQVIRRDG